MTASSPDVRHFGRHSAALASRPATNGSGTTACAACPPIMATMVLEIVRRLSVAACAEERSEALVRVVEEAPPAAVLDARPEAETAPAFALRCGGAVR